MADFNSAAALSAGSPKSLAALLAASEPRAGLWSPEELAAIFRHQMAAPLAADLGQSAPGGATPQQGCGAAEAALPMSPPTGEASPREGYAAAAAPSQSFADLLHQPSPALALLEAVKDFAKSNAGHADSGLPKEVAGILYYACIAVALVRLGKRISVLSDDELRRGLGWAVTQPWVDEETRRLLAKGLAQATPGGTPAGSTS